MYLAGDMAFPPEFSFMPLDDLQRTLPADAAERVILALDCATASRTGLDPDLLDRAPALDRRRPPPRQHPLRQAQPDRRRRILDRGDPPRPPSRAGRRADPGDRRGALRRARHRHGQVPVLEHHPEGARSRRGAARGRRQARSVVFPAGDLRIGRVRQPEAERAGAGPGRALCGRPADHHVPPPERLHRAGRGEEFAEGIIDELRAVKGVEMAATIREPPEPPDAPRRISMRSSTDELDVSAIARKRGGAATGGRPVSRPSGVDRRDQGVLC